ncbi:DUF6530 family protein [Proteus vulgaris]|uniref:DUF6530 family protein n=1 Tax=Proteus vulgaris TaxID=585 RepID=UPI0021B12195|nr:DUF6530 family protein [Proteus vulgaris]MCT6518034.1 DUF6530 family protein [Proteus vulgaris]
MTRKNKAIPNHLSHKPVIKLENYANIDGEYARTETQDTDTEGLSIGLAMWGTENKPALSAKVWRHTGDKWSRQSEEIPIHRVIDLASLICAAKLFSEIDSLPVDKEFTVTPTFDRDLIDKLKSGFDRDSQQVHSLDKSLKRLSAYLKKIGY